MKTAIGKTIGFALAALVVVGLTMTLPAAALGQGYGQGQSQQPPKVPPPQNPPAQQNPPANQAAPAPATSPEEDAAYKPFSEAKGNDPLQVIQLGEDFLKKYPTSRYAPLLYSRLATAYLSTGQEDKFFAAGEKALELYPDNVDVLALLGMVLPRRLGTLDAEQKLQKSEQYCKRAISLIAGMAKPAALTDEQFLTAKNEKLSMAHSGLGVVYFQRQRYADSTGELEQAVKLSPKPDPSDYYLLGKASIHAKHFSDAVTAFDKCSQINWPWQDRCKKEEEDAKKAASTQLSAPK